MVATKSARRTLDEILDRVSRDGPQRLTRHKKHYIIIEADEYDRLVAEQPKRMNFLDFLRSAPSFEGLDLERDKRPPRDIDFG